MFGRHPSDNQLEGKRLAASPPQPASMKSPGMLRRETHGSCCHSEAVFSIFSSSPFFKKSPSPFYVQKKACSLQISPFCCEPWPTHRDKSMPSTARHWEGLLSYMSSPSDQVLHFCNKEGIKGSQHQKKKHFPETFSLVNLLFSSGAFFCCLRKRENSATSTVPNFLFLPRRTLSLFLDTIQNIVLGRGRFIDLWMSTIINANFTWLNAQKGDSRFIAIFLLMVHSGGVEMQFTVWAKVSHSTVRVSTRQGKECCSCQTQCMCTA